MKNGGHTKKKCVTDSPAEGADEARLALCDFVEAVYNRKRRHSALGYLSLLAFERAAEAAAA